MRHLIGSALLPRQLRQIAQPSREHGFDQLLWGGVFRALLVGALERARPLYNRAAVGTGDHLHGCDIIRQRQTGLDDAVFVERFGFVWPASPRTGRFCMAVSGPAQCQWTRDGASLMTG